MMCLLPFLAVAAFAAVVQAQNDICSSGIPVAPGVCDGGEIPGIAGVDYPTYGEVPRTNFRCDSIGVPGYYADPEAACQAFYICGRQGKGTGFLCPNGTLFNQEFLVCDWWNHVDCSQAVSFYSVNQQIVAEMEAANERLGVNQRERERLAGITAFNPNFNPGLPNQVNPFINPYNRFNSTFPFNQNRFPAGPFAGPYNPNVPFNQRNPFNPFNGRFNGTTPYPFNSASLYNPALPFDPYNTNLPYSPVGPYNPLASRLPGQYPYDPRYPDPKNPLAYRNPINYPGQYPYDPRYPDPKNPLAPKYPGYSGQFPYDPRYPDSKNPLAPKYPGYPGQYPYDPRYPDLKNPLAPKYPGYPGALPYDPRFPDGKTPLGYPGQYPFDPRYPDPKNPLASRFPYPGQYPYDPRYPNPKTPGYPGQYPYDPRFPDPKNPFVTPRPGFPTPSPFAYPGNPTIAPFIQPGYSTPRPYSPSPTIQPSTISIGEVGTTQRPFGGSSTTTPQPIRPASGYSYNSPDREYLPPL